MIEVHLTVNGVEQTVQVTPAQDLLSVLRKDLLHTGAKEGCGVGECGACTVILDGRAAKACTVLAAQCEGSTVVTIEGLAEKGGLHPLQQAFIDHNAVQCGFCTAGFIMTALSFLQRTPHPTREEIAEAISGNLCRCTGYVQIIDAIEAYAAAANQ